MHTEDIQNYYFILRQKSAVVGYTRLLAVRDEFLNKNIRVNCVAPGSYLDSLFSSHDERNDS